MAEQEAHFLQRWFSIGDVISLIAMLLALGVTFGALSKDMEVVKQNVSELRAQRITPGAETALATITARDDAQDDQIRAIKEELRYQRGEILSALARLEARMDGRNK